jgi:hypothetical protein
MVATTSGRRPLAVTLIMAACSVLVAASARAQQEQQQPQPPPDAQSKKIEIITAPLPTGAREEKEVSCTTSNECADRVHYGEVCVAGKCQPYQDKTDLLEIIGLKAKQPAVLVPFKPYIAAIPVIGYAPAYGAVIGATVQIGMFLGDPETTTISSLKSNFFYTSNNQIVLNASLIALSANNEWELQGDYRLYLYNQSTYGLSTATAAVSNGISIDGIGQTAPVPGAQPMDFNMFRLQQSVLKKVVGHLYLGGAYLLNTYWNIDDLLLNLQATPPVVTSHYAYSTYFGFSTQSYAVSALAFQVLFDSRDSTINAYRGIYANMSFQGAPTWLGSSEDSTSLFAEFRGYLGLSPSVPRNVLAFWFYSQEVTSGHQPYLTLPSNGWDLDGNTGRGYVQGRFRGTSWLYAETELRLRLTNDGLLGCAFFVNAQTMSRPEATYGGTTTPAVNLFDVIRPAGGAGLRFMMNKEARTNIRMDIAAGYNSVAIYFGSGEAF